MEEFESWKEAYLAALSGLASSAELPDDSEAEAHAASICHFAKCMADVAAQDIDDKKKALL